MNVWYKANTHKISRIRAWCVIDQTLLSSVIFLAKTKLRNSIGTKGDGPRVSIRSVVTPFSDRLVDHRHWQLASRHNCSIIGWYCSEYLSSRVQQRVRICQPACSIALRFVGTVLLSDRKYEFIADYFTSFLHIRVNLSVIILRRLV